MKVLGPGYGFLLFANLCCASVLPQKGANVRRFDFGDIGDTGDGGFPGGGANPEAGGWERFKNDDAGSGDGKTDASGDNNGQSDDGGQDGGDQGANEPGSDVEVNGVTAKIDAATNSAEIDVTGRCPLQRRDNLLLARDPGCFDNFDEVQSESMEKFNDAWKPLSAAITELKASHVKFNDLEIVSRLSALDGVYPETQFELKPAGDAAGADGGARKLKAGEILQIYKDQMKALDRGDGSVNVNEALAAQQPWTAQLGIDAFNDVQKLQSLGQDRLYQRFSQTQADTDELRRALSGDEYNIRYDSGDWQISPVQSPAVTLMSVGGKLEYYDWGSPEGQAFVSSFKKFSDLNDVWSQAGHEAERVLEKQARLPPNTMNGVMRKLVAQRETAAIKAGSKKVIIDEEVNGVGFKVKPNQIVIKKLPLSTGEKIAFASGAGVIIAAGACQVINDNNIADCDWVKHLQEALGTADQAGGGAASNATNAASRR